jgi:hypothetical protein
MCKLNKKSGNKRIDPCIEKLCANICDCCEIVASCCGHGKYPMTILVTRYDGDIMDIVSNAIIPRKKRFYKKDKQGYYYIPETIAKLEGKG